MMGIRRIGFLLLVCAQVCVAQKEIMSYHNTMRKCVFFNHNKNTLTKPTRFFIQLLTDVALMYKNFIDWDSYKTVVAALPIFFTGSMVDHRVHECFYDFKTHRHLHDMPHGFHYFADKVVISLEVAVGATMFVFSKNDRLRETSKMFLLGLPFVIWTADLFKVILEKDFCYRPLHQDFCKDHQPRFGGFPSTHAAQVTFSTVVFGLQFGAPAIVPLSLLSALVIFPFINDNRHYVSQVVAGAGLGVLYGLAASKVVSSKFNDVIEVGCGAIACGKPALKLSYNF